jgi:hypothetical protein
MMALEINTSRCRGAVVAALTDAGFGELRFVEAVGVVLRQDSGPSGIAGLRGE